jgi:lipopolysaccharide export system protein LptA
MRTAILVLGALLVAAILAFLALRHFRGRLLHRDLPEALGARIQQSANGFTYSQSRGGHTLFTLHAARVEQFKDGNRSMLHDVKIDLYDGRGRLSDRIYGSQFAYDPSAGVARAQGTVEIEVATAAGPGGGGGGEGGPGRSLHVRTSGLEFSHRTGIASTAAALEFSAPELAGTAFGASFDSQKGLLVLVSRVELRTSVAGDALLLHAGHAELLRDTGQAFLLAASTEYRSAVSSADQATLYFRRGEGGGGSLEHAELEGKVRLRSQQTELRAPRAQLYFDTRSQPLKAHLSNGITFDGRADNHRTQGTADELFLDFAAHAAPAHLRLAHTASIVDVETPLPADADGLVSRSVRAGQLDVDFVPAADGRIAARKLLAQQEARLTVHSVRSNAAGMEGELGGDQLLAVFGPGEMLDQVTGSGHTHVTQKAAGGGTETSRGDRLEVRFAQRLERAEAPLPMAAGRPRTAVSVPAALVALDRAVQTGHVQLEQLPAPGAKTADGQPVEPLRGAAERAEYDGEHEILHLSGAPSVKSGQVELAAGEIDYDRRRGEASARGAVKATLSGEQGSPGGAGFGGSGPVHVVARQASLSPAGGDAVFRGDARLWQGADSVAAPVIEILRARRRLLAHGEQPAPAAVHSVLLSPPAHPGAAADVVRVASRTFEYDQAARVATFAGGVLAETGTTAVHADTVAVELEPADSQPSGVKKMTASGHVLLTSPGRRGTGGRLEYTAAGGEFRLSGESGAPPRLYDQTRGTITGQSVVFHSRDDSVKVEGGTGRTST